MILLRGVLKWSRGIANIIGTTVYNAFSRQWVPLKTLDQNFWECWSASVWVIVIYLPRLSGVGKYRTCYHWSAAYASNSPIVTLPCLCHNVTNAECSTNYAHFPPVLESPDHYSSIWMTSEGNACLTPHSTFLHNSYHKRVSSLYLYSAKTLCDRVPLDTKISFL